MGDSATKAATFVDSVCRAETLLLFFFFVADLIFFFKFTETVNDQYP